MESGRRRFPNTKRESTSDLDWAEFALRKRIANRLLTLFSLATVCEIVMLTAIAVALLINGKIGYGAVAICLLVARMKVHIGKLLDNSSK
jgi:hypothetical protein